MCRTGKPASALLSCFTPAPQKLVNLTNMDKTVLNDKRVIEQVAAVTTELADAGRVLLRPSGTEPVIRVMVEAVDEGRLDATMDKLVTVLKTASQD